VDPRAFVAFAAVFGAVVGSFLNVVIHRLPRGESIVSPGSRCPSCGRAIRPWHNVPVLAWLWLRGAVGCTRIRRVIRSSRLRPRCSSRSSPSASATPMAWIWMAFGAALLAAAVIDADHRIIPDEISVGGLVAGLSLVPAVRVLAGAGAVDAWLHAATGAALGGGLLWIVGFAHARLCAAPGGASSTGPRTAKRSRARVHSTTGPGSPGWASATSSCWR
jgi:leader peptidase (prepilin peptidase)/N-methyltransferase